MHRDVIIFGGGVAGLWLLDELVRRGYSAVLVETAALGSGQTVASQGILHGGLKYTLQGLLTGSAAAIRELPALWRDCLVGRREPRLTRTPIRSEHCYLWRTESVASRLGMIGARFGLRVAPQTLAAVERPTVLAGCPGTVARLDEQVVSPAGLMADFHGRHRERLLLVSPDGIQFETSAPGHVTQVRLSWHPDVGRAGDPSDGRAELVLTADRYVFTAGAGNAGLREGVGLDAAAMQRRPLHMVLVRGPLPILNGHCVDGAKTRVTITSDCDRHGRTVWQVGGHVSEWGVAHEPEVLLPHARAEIEAVLPGVDLSAAEWSTYRVDRAEGRTTGGGRPDTLQIRHEGNVTTAWPTKLVLAPRLAEEIADSLAAPRSSPVEALPADWPCPAVADPPWETAREWRRLDDSAAETWPARSAG